MGKDNNGDDNVVPMGQKNQTDEERFEDYLKETVDDVATEEEG